jgi:hypothetical protein
MSSTVMMDRTGMMPGVGGSPMAGPTGMPAAPSFLMVPRCTLKVERCPGGMRIDMVCDDATACGMVQNLCQMLAGGMCGLSCLMNGMVACSCNLTMGMCRCETTAKGCCITCTSGDPECCKMIQACCDCVATMLKAGCTGCVTMGGSPICCGTC